MGVSVEGEGQVVGAALGDVIDVIILRPSIAPVVVAHNLEGNRGAVGQLYTILNPGVQTVNQRHVGLGVGVAPLRAEDRSRGASNAVLGQDNGSHITLHLERHGVGVEGKLVGFTKGASKTVGYITVGRFLSGVLNARAHLLTRSEGTITVIAVERVPVIVGSRGQSIGKHKPNGAANLVGNIGVNTVPIIGHLHTSIGVPITEWVVTHNVHCRIGVKTNEGNQQ